MTLHRYVLGIDQGTTYSKAVVLNYEGEVVARSVRQVPRYFPQRGWVEQDAEEIWSNTLEAARVALADARVSPDQLEAIGLCAQMGTAVVWNRSNLRPIGRAVSWQDNRTRGMCELLNSTRTEKVAAMLAGSFVTNATGPKIKWLIDNDFAVQSGVAQGNVAAGSMSSWILANLSGNQIFSVDYASAATTQLVDLHTLTYHDELLSLVEVPRAVLPQIRPSGDIYGVTSRELFDVEVPISSVLGDIPASALGAGSTRIGDTTLSLGTGAFLLNNTGEVCEGPGVLPIVVDADGFEVVYGALGSANVSGAAVEWLQSGLSLIGDPTEVDGIASQVPDSGGVVFVPAFAGLAMPPDPYATGLLIGLGQETTRANIVRAVLEGMAFQVRDMLQAVSSGSGQVISSIRVTGGASASDVLMQILADTLGIPLERSAFTDSAAIGAAFRAGVGVGFWASLEEASGMHRPNATFEPRTSADRREHRYVLWKKAVRRAQHWET